MNVVQAIAQKDLVLITINAIHDKLPKTWLDKMIDKSTWNDRKIEEELKIVFDLLIEAKEFLWEDTTREKEILKQITAR